MLPQATADLYRANQRRMVALRSELRIQWSRLTTSGNWDDQWSGIEGRVTALVASAQYGAALDGAASVPASLAQQGVPARQEYTVQARALAGTASDGRGLASLLRLSVQESRDATGGAAQMLLAGGEWLALVAHMQVVDAARVASGLAITATPNAGWVRMVNPPCCGKCLALAGKHFQWNTGFQRHPGCDCTHVPAAAGKIPWTPTATSAQVTDLTKAEAKAIADGADMHQVLNARRGRMGMYTTEGTTRRGYAYYAMRTHHGAFTETVTAASRYTKAVGRLTPETIYRIATDRNDALRLLRTYGYLS